VAPDFFKGMLKTEERERDLPDKGHMRLKIITVDKAACGVEKGHMMVEILC
jgi:hypothetical protein